VLVDDFKKYVNAWTADGGIAVLYRWNNVGAAIEQLKKIYGLEPGAQVNSLDALQEAVVGTLYPKKILGTARVGDLSIPIHRHLYDQAQSRGIDLKTIERTLRRLPRIASKLKKIEAGNKVWVYNPHDEISLGFFALDSGGYLLNTVIPNAPHQQGVTDVIRMYEADIEENFADGKVKGRSRPGRVKRAGASCDGSVTSLRAKAKKYSGERGRMYHWCANMKSGRQK
jgi:hypothetical protein